MPPDPIEPGAGPDEPGYWLVAGLEWPGGTGVAEAAFATAPELIPRETLSHDAYQVLGCADLYAAKHGARVVFFSDLTRMFAGAGRTWSDLGVDWQSALAEIQDGPYPTMLLTVNERAYMLICDPAVDYDQGDQNYSYDWVNYERDMVRQAIVDKLAADWPGYINRLIKSGRARRVD